MTKLVLEKTEEFNKVEEPIKNRLDEIFVKEFKDLNEIISELYKDKKIPLTIYIPKESSIKINRLPFTIKYWPLYYDKSLPYEKYLIAIIKVID